MKISSGHTTTIIGTVILSLSVGVFYNPAAYGEAYTLHSPNEELTVNIAVEEVLTWSIKHKNQVVLRPSEIALAIKNIGELGRNAKVEGTSIQDINTVLKPVIKVKSAEINENYRELTVHFAGNYQVNFRAYNNGVAYRFQTQLPTSNITINSETVELDFPSGTTSLFPEEESFVSHFERLYQPVAVKDVQSPAFASLPIYFNVNGKHVVLTEADLFDYPGLFLQGSGGSAMRGIFPGFVTKAEPAPGAEDRNELVTAADYIAMTSGTRTYPWRVLAIGESEASLIENQLVYLLSRDNVLENVDWIQPGRVAWDWYNANNIYGVDFKSGDNTATYKYYIDFASKYGLEYVILDEGWSKSSTEVKEPNPEINVKELIEYGRKKKVGIILWSLWKPIDNDMEGIFKLYSEWGAKGVKIDFMQRADQAMVNYYERAAKVAAKYHLLVDFHGAYKPAGLRRAYPNVISYEGVKGNENNKWSQDITPEHNVTLPFIRMLAGPMDYTPGAMSNAQLINHKIIFDRPMSLGTRAHQVAMYVVYESPLQMLCDSPSAYLNDPQVTEFISRFPSVWDETKVLDAKITDYVVIARRKGNTWYIGAMTDWTPRELEIDFSFLAKGKYKIDFARDGVNADRYAEDYKIESKAITRSTVMTIKMAPGGGWAAILTKK